ncbi:peroxiredoxin [Streptomyces bathyalis]|uniref:Peroxiredoxin n=1 Tax=Streptomyces bathyalis TaxID=2710756 RepID=A0A7T1T3P4_9ACTN|nr:peroxiredoxin [Streptomyces bathyalis]QPP05838.1 peroxiredoxin [Streptomyces bathyalis]
MSVPHDPAVLPGGLPVPTDDGACDHLPGRRVPALQLPSTGGVLRDPHAESRGRWTVLFCYPRTGRPGEAPPGGEAAWNATPGARGCTPQCVSYAGLREAFGALGAVVYGVSTQSTDEQLEAARRLELPYELLSDGRLELTEALGLPTFTAAGLTLLRRHTLVLKDGFVNSVRYPVFPSDGDAEAVLSWLRARTA